MRRRLAAMILVLGMVLVVPTGPAGAQAQSFDDLRAEFGYTEGHAAVMRLYRAFFEREPDVGGAEYWLIQYDLGATLDDIAWAFAASTEFTTRYGADLDNAEFLSIVYGNVLGRTPDQEGFDYWLGQMNGGLARPEVVRWVTANAEFIQRFPYSPTADWLSMLPTADEVGAGWVENQPARASLSAPHDGCDNVVGTGGRYVTQSFLSGDRSQYASFSVVDLGSVGAASTYVSRLLGLPDPCPQMMAGEVALTVELAAGLGVGDQAMVWQGTFAVQAGDRQDPGYLVAVRRGSRVALVMHVGRNARPAGTETDVLVAVADAHLANGPTALLSRAFEPRGESIDDVDFGG